MGMGSLVMQSIPVLYEGVNEHGLMGGQLYYREFARYAKEEEKGKDIVQPAYVVTYILTQCQNIEEVKQYFKEKMLVFNTGIFGKIPDIHWFFSDPSGASVVVEIDEHGLHLFDKNLGVLTNSPNYDWHCHHMREFAVQTPHDAMGQTLNGQPLAPCYSGTGMNGIPGDWSSPSRFVRLALMHEYAVKGKDEKEGVTRLCRLLQNVAFSLGTIAVGDTSDLDKYDGDVSAYDYTIYTAVMCAESLSYYYNDLTLHHVSMEQFKDSDEVQIIPVSFE